MHAENTITRSELRLENRLLCAVLAFELMKGMATGGLWILSSQSVMSRIAATSTYPTLLAATWVALSLFVVPYFVVQLFNLKTRYSGVIAWCGRRAILCSGVIWFFFAFLSRNLDYEYVTIIFIANGTTCAALAVVLANTINNAQRRGGAEE